MKNRHRIKQFRYFSSLSRQRKDRAQRFYVWICRADIMLDRSGDVLQYIAARMIGSGMVRKSHSDACYSILRRLWKIDAPFKMRWHDWTTKNGWRCLPWGQRRSGVSGRE